MQTNYDVHAAGAIDRPAAPPRATAAWRDRPIAGSGHQGASSEDGQGPGHRTGAPPQFNRIPFVHT
jgi:hypothetical protein